MVITDENNPIIIISKPTIFQGGVEEMGSRKLGQGIRPNRRALGVINQNLVGSGAYPCVVNKRGSLTEKNGVLGKKTFDSVKPPTTRSRAQELDPEGIKKLKPSNASMNNNAFGDCIFIDVEEPKASTDQPIPMSLEETNAGHSEANPMEEVEMEDIIIEEEPIIDIDKSDAKNSLAVVEYIEDLFEHYREMEGFSCVSPDYMAQQCDINEKMRAILIDWLIEVHDKFDLMDETLFLTINLIDRFLSKQGVVRKKLQLIGLVAMLLACKYEEVSVPVVEDLVLISDKAYTRQDVLEMEKLMLNTLQFNMSSPTPYVFLKRFLKAAQSDKKIETVASFLIELALVEYEMLRFAPSLLAAAAVYTAHCTLHRFRQWNSTCEWHSHYSEDQLLECSRMMVSFHQKAESGKLTGVYRKYSSSRFEHTAECEPAEFLLESHLP